MNDLKNRGVTDVFFIVCDGLNGPPDSVGQVLPDAIVQTPPLVTGHTRHTRGSTQLPG